jgi:hypothetical protein
MGCQENTGQNPYFFDTSSSFAPFVLFWSGLLRLRTTLLCYYNSLAKSGLLLSITILTTNITTEETPRQDSFASMFGLVIVTWFKTAQKQ